MQGAGGRQPAVKPLPWRPKSGIDSAMTIPDGASRLSNKQLVDKIKGAIYGQAIGDAVGLLTEFMSKAQAAEIYGPRESRKHLDLSEKYNDGHRVRWLIGDWTDDTDQMIAIMDSVLHHGGRYNIIDIAAHLKFWRDHGCPELGDAGGMGLGSTVNAVLSHPSFLRDPHTAARTVWIDSNRFLAANGAVMRTAIVGIAPFHDLHAVHRNAENVCKITHADPRCVASCVAVSAAIAAMLQGLFDTTTEKGVEDLIEFAFDEAVNVPELNKEEFMKFRRFSSWSELKLDERNAIGYTYKCLGAGFHGLRTGGNDFEGTMIDLAMEAGDADTNGAVCGALLGCKLGYENLPDYWLKAMPHKAWLDEKVATLLQLLGLKDE